MKTILSCLFITVLALSCTKKQTSLVIEKDCDDTDLIYKTCTDQNLIYSQALEEARKESKILLVSFGFENCPWCANLHEVFKNNNIKYVEKNFIVVNVNIKENVGKSIFEKIKGKHKKTSLKTGYPFLVLVNPKGLQSTYIETPDLEENSDSKKGHNLVKLKSALKLAQSKLNE